MHVAWINYKASLLTCQPGCAVGICSDPSPHLWFALSTLCACGEHVVGYHGGQCVERRVVGMADNLVRNHSDIRTGSMFCRNTC